MIENELVKVSTEGELGNIIKLSPQGSARDISMVPCILSSFEEASRQNFRYFILDLSHLRELPPGLIVLLFELTARVRRKGGDLQIVSLGSVAQNHLLTFNPLSYLTASTSEEAVVAEFEMRAKIAAEPEQGFLPEATSGPFTSLGMTLPRSTHKNSIEIPSRVDALYHACDFVTGLAKNMGFAEPELGKIKLAVYEACLNAVEHAYHSDPNRFVKVAVETAGEKLVVAVIDRGEGFKVDKAKDFDVIEAVVNRKTGGMGLHLIRRSVDQVRYEIDPLVGNKLIMIKNLHKSADSSI